MESITLNYSYRFPRIWFKNGSSTYGNLYTYYNKVKKQLEYYFADSNEIRKFKLKNKELAIERLRRMKNKIDPNDILRVEYLS